MAKLARGKTNAASGQHTVSEHNRARNQKARGTHDARRNLLHRDADAEIGRAPEDIDQPKGNNDLPLTRGRVHFHEMRVEVGKFRISECGKSAASYAADHIPIRSEEHTSEL